MIEFQVEGNTYRSGKLSAFQQLHLSRKLGVLLPKVIPAFAKLQGEAQDLAMMAEALAPAAEALAALPDADAEFIYSTCLSVVKRQQGNAFAPVWNASASTPMFEDVALDVLTQLVFKVVADQLGPFIRSLLAKIQAEPTPADQAA